MRVPRILLATLTAAALAFGASFQAGVEVARFPASLDEISGLVLSRAQTGVLWVHNDSGDQPRVYAVSAQGKLLGTYLLEGAAAVDWEDIAIGPAPNGGSYLYLADIGDNAGRRNSVRIYRVLEPRVNPAQTPLTQKLSGVVAYEFVYADGPRDAEGFMVDPLTGDFYIVTKREAYSRLYRFHAPDPTHVNTLHQEASFPFSGVTGAEISPDGMQVLIRRYSNILFEPTAAVAGSYWKRQNISLSLVDLLKQPSEMLPLVFEAQGEAIAFAPNNRGFYTTSEKVGPDPSPLTFYPPAQ